MIIVRQKHEHWMDGKLSCYSGKYVFSQTRVGNTYISSIMLNCKCSPRKLGFGKSFVVLELFVQLLRQCLVCGLWKHADGCISAQKKVTVVRCMYSQNWCKNENPWLICEIIKTLDIQLSKIQEVGSGNAPTTNSPTGSI